MTEIKRAEKKFYSKVRVIETKTYDLEVPLFANDKEEAMQIGLEIIGENPERCLDDYEGCKVGANYYQLKALGAEE